MKTWHATLALLLAVLPLNAQAAPYDFGDKRSVTLVSKAWTALAEDDFNGVLTYTNKAIDLYAEKAREMQSGLSGYPEGEPDKIHSYWALNDVSTALFIQGKALLASGEKNKAKQAFERVVNEFSYGQCWDEKGWFWKPAEAAQEQIQMIESGILVDFGDNSSSTLVTNAWKGLEEGDFTKVHLFADKTIELYAAQAKLMQAGLTDYPQGENETIFGFWALNDVATAHFIKAKAYEAAGQYADARDQLESILNDYRFGQCWDPQGWWWKPSDAAEEMLAVLEDQPNNAEVHTIAQEKPVAAPVSGTVQDAEPADGKNSVWGELPDSAADLPDAEAVTAAAESAAVTVPAEDKESWGNAGNLGPQSVPFGNNIADDEADVPVPTNNEINNVETLGVEADRG